MCVNNYIWDAYEWVCIAIAMCVCRCTCIHKCASRVWESFPALSLHIFICFSENRYACLLFNSPIFMSSLGIYSSRLWESLPAFLLRIYMCKWSSGNRFTTFLFSAHMNLSLLGTYKSFLLEIHAWHVVIQCVNLCDIYTIACMCVHVRRIYHRESRCAYIRRCVCAYMHTRAHFGVCIYRCMCVCVHRAHPE